MTVLQPPRTEILPYFDRLKPEYRVYCKTVSRRSMALSIDAAAYLWWLCDLIRPRSVADLGSGFSSFVLRSYAAQADHPVTVDSVDSDRGWLNQTRQFCESNGLPDGGFLIGDDWERSATRYDVVLNDYDSGRTRERFAEIGISKLTPAGVIMFDDAQNAEHHDQMSVACIRAGLTFMDVRHQTVDETGRFACIGART